MELQRVLLFVCAIYLADAFRVNRDVENATDAESSIVCCYPRPPPARNFKRCCHVPMEIIFKEFETDREACKEEMKKKPDEDEDDVSSSTTTTTISPPVEKEEADLDTMGMEETEDAHPEVVHGGRNGKGHKCHKHHKRGKGKCLTATMEKHGWYKNKIVDWPAIIRDVDIHITEEIVAKWAPTIKDAAVNCSRQLPSEVNEGKQGRHERWYNPGRAAMKCMKNNAIMNCPDFPEEDEYCRSLREVHQRCGARKQPGKKRLPWCEPKSKSHRKRT